MESPTTSLAESPPPPPLLQWLPMHGALIRISMVTLTYRVTLTNNKARAR
jgi:hypothetical protein